MKLQSLMLRNSLLILTLILALPAFPAAAQSKPDGAPVAQTAAIPARITQAIDETQLVRLRGNVHPLARPEFDQGIVSDATPMNRMLLLLERSPEQETALQQFMVEQQMKDSPNFHKWLTPEQFGKQFGPADVDIQAITDWLTRQGFHDFKVGAGRTAIEFSGSVGQVRNAFHTEVHHFTVNGEARQANVSDPQIPAALTPVVAGVVSLHNFPKESMRHHVGAFMRTADGRVIPQFTSSTGAFYAVGPADFAKIYNVTPSGLNGTGTTIAIVGDSNINPQDMTDYRTLFGLPANPPSVILNGPDPGLGSSEGEADLDVELAGAVAPNAKIDLVVSESTLTADGIDLSALYIIDNNIADVMSESFGACESGLGTAGNQFFNALWEQAAAQGITAMVSSGDPGSAGCDNFNTAKAATLGLAVNGIASTPFNVAVGGTDFDDVGKQASFWNTSNLPLSRESALGYIPETTWNDSCAATATSANLNSVCAGAAATNIVGGGGGPSGIYAKPSFQSGITPHGIAAGDNHRYTPDVALFASDGPMSKSFYAICEADAIKAGSPPSCVPDSSGHFSFLGVGGTSASSPAFAGIMALIIQSNGRQGNANPVLYRIAATAGQSCNSSTEALSGSTCAFNDVTKGNNSVPCTANSPAGTSPNCSSTTAGTNGVLVSTASPTTPAWTTAIGYDLATGLGSVNVANLVTQWPIAVGNFHTTATSLTLNGGTSTVNITHGTAVTATVTVTSTSGTPTGDVSLIAPTSVNGGIGDGTLSSGTVTVNNVILPGGSYNVNARYAGDTTFASSTSSPGVPVVVSKENSGLQIGIVTLNGNTVLSTNATSFAYGSSYILRFDILNRTGNSTNCQPLANTSNPPISGCAFDATGKVTITDNGSPLDAGTFPVNSAGSGEDQPIQLLPGSHTLSASYSGDISYNPAGPVTDTLTVTKATTSTQVVPSVNSITSGGSITLTATVKTNSNGVGPTGTVQFKNGASALGAAATCTPNAATSTAAAFCTATLTTTLSFITPPSGPNRLPNFRYQPVLLAVFMVFLLFLLSSNKFPAAHRRRSTYVALFLFIYVLAGAAGCGSGGGGGHTDSITAAYSGDGNYSASTSAPVSITIQ